MDVVVGLSDHGSRLGRACLGLWAFGVCVGHDHEVVKRQSLASGGLDALYSDIDFCLVQAFVDVFAEAQLFADRLQHRLASVLLPRGAVRSLGATGRGGALGCPFLVAGEAGRGKFSEPMLLLVDALLGNVDLVDGLGRRVVDLGGDGSLADAHPVLVDKLDEQASLLIGDWEVLFGHPCVFVVCFLKLYLITVGPIRMVSEPQYWIRGAI